MLTLRLIALAPPWVGCHLVLPYDSTRVSADAAASRDAGADAVRDAGLGSDDRGRADAGGDGPNTLKPPAGLGDPWTTRCAP